ncbi:S-adenosyl methyltransferase [Streptomyces sp. 3211.6]|uniref:SAM-dependent methyltransferase n=1 Tax=Streptomyces sp. 3211.6 TaxID=1938845 RepID=UPI000F1CF137|nr:SAM-dependent methyltransferase [Streptomyces sp. 3211.6]RKT02917.1 S-adenosyl methyltransferase [Streptomyces sp. 3211.6]
MNGTGSAGFPDLALLSAEAGEWLRRPSAARVSTVWQDGGRNAYPADLDLAERLLEVFPRQADAAAINREHAQLTARELVDRGITQFLDLGCGYPLLGHLCEPRLRTELDEIVYEASPHARVVHVDVDRTAVAHSRAMRRATADSHGPVVLHGDILEMAHLLDAVQALRYLSLNRPVGVFLHDVLPWAADDEQVLAAMACLRRWLPLGSVLSITHASPDLAGGWLTGAERVLRQAGIPYRPRSRSSIAGLFGDWPDFDGGPLRLVPTAQHHDEHRRRKASPATSAAYAGVAVKPLSPDSRIPR